MFDEEKIIAAWNAEMYEKFETETKDVDFLLSVIGSKPLKILEAACGGGRILISLGQAGHDAAGFVIEKEYGDYAGNPIGEKTNRAIIWATKKIQAE